MMASVRLWIPQRLLTLQSVLMIGALMLLGLALAFGVSVHPPVLLTTTTLNPITATIAGFILAGAVEAAGGFAAASNMLVRLSKGFFGLSGTIILLVNSPTIFAMPCGRVWAAALIPAALMFGFELARRHGNPALVPIIIFGLITNAAASCGPSPLGGIGMMGEGIGGFLLGSFVKPQQLAIMVMTLVTMVAMGAWRGIRVDPLVLGGASAQWEEHPRSAYLAFLFYVLGLVAVFVFKPPVPIQTILLGMTLVVMIAGRVGFNDLIAGVILHPLTAMIAGFIMAGALVVTGAFDTLVFILSWLAFNTPLGFIGVAILLIYLPIIFPMPCGRVMVAALLPGVIMFGQKLAEITKFPPAFSGLLIAFILCCAASCVPSPLGGIGAIGEGNLGMKQGIAAKPLQLGILLGVPVAALVATFFGLSAEIAWRDELFLLAGVGLLFGVVTNLLLGERFYRVGGLSGGLLSAGLMLVM
jgi:hypothetical protein